VSGPTTDVIRRVFCEGGEAFIEVGPWADDTDLVELRTIDGKHSAEWFGKTNVAMTKPMATALGRALIAASKGQA
jgi:hypothetical protein